MDAVGRDDDVEALRRVTLRGELLVEVEEAEFDEGMRAERRPGAREEDVGDVGEAVVERAARLLGEGREERPARAAGPGADLEDPDVAAHRERFGSNGDADLYVGLQLTHSGRYSRPNVYDRPEPFAGWHHPALDRRFPNGVRVFEDEELDRLVDDFVAAARLAPPGRRAITE